MELTSKFLEIFKLIPKFASCLDLEKHVKRIIVDFKNHYNNKPEMLDAFARMVRVLENFPETSKRIVEDNFNFTYMDRLASGLRNDENYIR